MEDSFLLKHYGHLNLSEQYQMTGEERSWWLKRIETENTKIAEKNNATNTPAGKIAESPGRPPV